MIYRVIYPRDSILNCVEWRAVGLSGCQRPLVSVCSSTTGWWEPAVASTWKESILFAYGVYVSLLYMVLNFFWVVDDNVWGFFIPDVPSTYPAAVSISC